MSENEDPPVGSSPRPPVCPSVRSKARPPRPENVLRWCRSRLRVACLGPSLHSSLSAMLPGALGELCGWRSQLAVATALLAAAWLLVKLWRHTRERQIRLIPASGTGVQAHRWSLIECLSHHATCCLCQSLIVDAVLCDSCGVCFDFSCYKKTRSLGQCKQVSVSAGECRQEDGWRHHWVHGNIPANSVCAVCRSFCEEHSEEEAESEHTLRHFRCCWCQRTVHENCFRQSVDSACDFGPFRRHIVPPHCVIHKRVWPARPGRSSILLESVRDFRCEEPDWSPLFVVTNRKSGNNEGGLVLSAFLPVLNPLQVVDLGQDCHCLQLSLQICGMLPAGVASRILVAGGDGTVCWVLDELARMRLDPPPAVAILPLGTGNDLARVLGWADLFEPSSLDRGQLIEAILRSEPTALDRWAVAIRPTSYYRRSCDLLLAHLHIPRAIMPWGERDLFMYNYLSVGVDALVALNFHQTRKSALYKFLFTNRLVNKFIYFTYGTKDILERRCRNLQHKIRVQLDGRWAELPQLESVIILNISSWGGGVQMLPQSERHRMDDRLLEVLAVTSSFHIGQLMVGLSKPIFLGQARHVRLQLSEHLPVQADGEPWLQQPCTLEVRWHSCARVLQCAE